MRSCPKCGMRIPETEPGCPRCRNERAPLRIPTATKAPPWELWAAMGFVGLGIAGNVLAMKILPAVLGATIVIGLLLRKGWALWWSVIGGLLGAVFGFFAFQGQPALIAVAVAVNLLVVGLLISCKVRDAY